MIMMSFIPHLVNYVGGVHVWTPVISKRTDIFPYLRSSLTSSTRETSQNGVCQVRTERKSCSLEPPRDRGEKLQMYSRMKDPGLSEILREMSVAF